jgi:UDP-glucose:(heptosyl)LPS alpha-1,3-glucosyltransferase
VRIALVAHHARPGGGQDRYLLELARHLAPRHDVHLVVSRAEGCDGMGVTVHELGLPDRPVLALSHRFARQAAAVIASQRFDVVHGVGGSLPGATVITAQYCHLAWHEARARYHVHEGRVVDRLYHALVDRQNVAYERRAYGSPALRQVIAVSRGTSAELQRFYAVPERAISVVYNGADPAVFDRARYPDAAAALRAELRIGDASTVALLVGTFWRKGLDTAIAAAGRASEALHLVVAGSGDTARAQRCAAAAGMSRRLHLLGPRADIARLYAAADIFLLPTRYEPFGMVIAEAMQSSLPVIVSASAGAAELITPGVSGFTVDAADDVEGFATHLHTLLADPRRRIVVGREARAAAMAVSWPQVAAQTEAVYHRAAGAA